jgi:hypothetical protein
MKVFTSLFVFCVLLQTTTTAQSYYQPQPAPKKTSSYSSGYVNPSTTYNNGYIKDNGTFVQPHVKTKSNETNWDNYSTDGNTNPYTQDKGTKAKDYSSGAYNYGSGQVIQTGERGGQYYINKNGNKVYVPKR